VSQISVYLGRFQPFHNGHFKTLAEALARSGEVIVFVGSSRDGARTLHDPFTFYERERMIRESLPEDLRWFVSIYSLSDRPTDDEWAAAIREVVNYTVRMTGASVALTGFKKDASSYYLDLFPEWKFEPAQIAPINATDIRAAYFGGADDSTWKHLVPDAVYSFLVEFRETNDFQRLVHEYKGTNQ
jgi:bifunctional NMN adenylyltransferase/nudix hydrolase